MSRGSCISRQRLELIHAEVRTWPQVVQEQYRQMVKSGTSPVMAHMFASRQAPRCLTDSTVMTGQQRIKDLPDGYRQMLCNELKKNGAIFSMEDSYQPGLANRFGDPEALVGHGQGRDHIRKLCEKRGVDSEGIVTVKGSRCVEKKEPKRVHKLHPRIVENIRQRMIEEDPGLAFRDQNKLREEIIDKHALKTKE